MISRIIIALFLISNVAFGTESPCNISLKLKNISDYTSYYIIIPVDENGSYNGADDVRRSQLAVGDEVDEKLELNSLYTLIIGTEKDDIRKQLNQKFLIDLAENCFEGGCNVVAGYHNYAIKDVYFAGAYNHERANFEKDESIGRIQKVKEILNGDNDYPRNPNPIIGGMALFGGICQLGKACLNAYNIFRSSTVTTLIETSKYKNTPGVRILVKNLNSMIAPGIELSTHTMRKRPNQSHSSSNQNYSSKEPF